MGKQSNKLDSINIEEFTHDCKTMVYKDICKKYKINHKKVISLIEKYNIVRPKIIFINNRHINFEEFAKNVPLLSVSEMLEKYNIKEGTYLHLRKELGLKEKPPIHSEKKKLAQIRISSMIEERKNLKSNNELGKKHGFSRQRASQILLQGGMSTKEDRKKKREEKLEKIKELSSEGKDGFTICEILGMTYSQFATFCTRNNLKIPFHNKKWTEEVIRSFMLDYRDRMSHKELAKKYNTGVFNVNMRIGNFKKLGY